MAIRLKDFMNIQTGFFVFIVVVIIVVGMSMSSENNYLNPSGNRNPANQKLMVVDQDSGEISFIQKSLQGVNAQIVADDSVISDAVAKLRTDLDKWNGDRSAEIQAIQRDYATNIRTKAIEDDIKLFKKENGMDVLRANLDSKIGHGEGIVIGLSKSTYGSSGWDTRGSGYGYRAITGFKQVGRGIEPEGGWRPADINFGHGENGTTMKLFRQNKFK